MPVASNKGRAARCCAKKPPDCCGSQLSDGSVRYAHRLIRAALQDAVVEEFVASNVGKNLRISHRYRPKFTPWTSDEAKRFLKAARDDRWYALYSVALAIGLRRGEALALRWADSTWSMACCGSSGRFSGSTGSSRSGR